MLNEATIQNLNEEFDKLEEEIEILRARRKGIADVLGIKLTGRGKRKDPVQSTPQEETTSEPPQNASNEEPQNTKIFDVPLSFSFSFFDSKSKQWVKVQDKGGFAPGIIFQAIAGNRVVPFDGHHIMEVVEVGEGILKARKYLKPLA